MFALKYCAALVVAGIFAAGCGERGTTKVLRPSNEQFLRELYAKLAVSPHRFELSELDRYDPEPDSGNDIACRIASYWYDIERDKRDIALDSGWVASLVYWKGEPDRQALPAGSVPLCECTSGNQ